MKYLGRYLSRLLGKSLTRAFSALPACIRAAGIAVAWFRNLDSISGTIDISDPILDEVQSSSTIGKIATAAGGGYHSYIAVEGSVYSVFYSSNDGDSWSESTVPTEYDEIRGLKYLNNLFFIFGIGEDLEENSTIYISYTSDFLSWTTNTVLSPTNTEVSDLEYYSNLYILIADSVDEGVFTSTDLSTWTSRIVNAGDSGPMEVIVHDGTNFVIIPRQGDSRAYSSSDGISWWKADSNTWNDVSDNAAVLSNGTIVIGALYLGDTPTGPLYYSSDSGDTWNKIYIEDPYWGTSPQCVSCVTTNGTDLYSLRVPTGGSDVMLIYTPDILASSPSWTYHYETDINIINSNSYISFYNDVLIWAKSDLISTSPNVFDYLIGRLQGATSVEYDYIRDVIGDREDTVFFGQYLTNASGQINLYRSSGTYDYTDPSDGSLSAGNVIPGDGLITVPANGICDIGIYPREGYYLGLLNFDGTDDYVEFSSLPSGMTPGSGNVGQLSFKAYINSSISNYRLDLLFIDDVALEVFTSVYIIDDNGTPKLRVNYGTFGRGVDEFDMTGYEDQQLNIILELNEPLASGTTCSVNTNTITVFNDTSGDNTPVNMNDDSIYIGYYDHAGPGEYFSEGVYVWDIQYASSWHVQGQPAGNLDPAWEDTIGSNDGTVNGTPTTIDIGTADDAVYTSFYPCCERAGTVLHDVSTNSKHISVLSPNWGETLYGSDYLNQYGYVSREDYDSVGYTWESIVNGSSTALNINCLIPLTEWTYEPLLDGEGDPILDGEGDPILVKTL